MAMGTRRRRQRQEELWNRADLAEAPGHPFFRRPHRTQVGESSMREIADLDTGC
jgi:hypothetical protein